MTQRSPNRRGAGGPVPQRAHNNAAPHAPGPTGLLRSGGRRGRPSTRSAAPKEDVGVQLPLLSGPPPRPDPRPLRGLGVLPQRHHFLEARETPPAQALAVSGCRPSVARFPAPPGSGVLGADATELWSPSPSPTCGSRKGRERSEGWPRGGREGAAALPPKLPFYSGVIGVHRLVQPWAKSISLLSDTVAEGER